MADPDFAAAATRHLRDARLLYDHGRYDNVLYLSGYVVECSLKSVASWHGVRTQAYGHGLVKLEGDALELAIAMAPAASRYRPPSGCVHAVSDRWSTSIRYAPDHVTPGMAVSVVGSSETVWRASVGAMWLDGLIQELP